jgi:hypothetical protein
MPLPLHQVVGRISHAVGVVSQDDIEIVVISVVSASSLLGKTADLKYRGVPIDRLVISLVPAKARERGGAHTIFHPSLSNCVYFLRSNRRNLQLSLDPQDLHG